MAGDRHDFPPGEILNLVHRYTSRADGSLSLPSILAGRASIFTVLAGMGLSRDDLVLGEQVHGNAVRTVTAADRGRPPFPGTDGFATRDRGVAILVRGADCPLVLLSDPARPAIAVVHAGWRGILAGVLAGGLKALDPIDPSAVRAYLGPCAGPCCYEVGEEVARRFPASAVVRGPGRPHLDLPAAVEIALGLPLDRAAHRCTICSKDHYSFRRDGEGLQQALVAALL